jgi:hypothetical protein
VLDDERLCGRLAAERRHFLLTREDDVRFELAEAGGNALRPERADAPSRCEIDAESCALHPRSSCRPCARLGDRPGEQGIARDVKDVDAPQPADVQFLRPQPRCRAAIRQHRPLVFGADHRHDDTPSLFDDRPDDLDAAGGDIGEGQVGGGSFRAW